MIWSIIDRMRWMGYWLHSRSSDANQPIALDPSLVRRQMSQARLMDSAFLLRALKSALGHRRPLLEGQPGWPLLFGKEGKSIYLRNNRTTTTIIKMRPRVPPPTQM
jgi:hypothetical protein